MKGNNRLLGVGSIVGTLPDLLYCASVHNEDEMQKDEMQIRTSYSNDECVDWRVLHKLREGSPDNPFRMHAIKWYVKSSPGVTKLVVRPRECVLLDCVGEMTLPNGERIGYFMYHSIDIPGCEPMDGFVRGLISAMYLFRTKGPNTVEVFMRSVCEMGGVNDSIAALSVANGLIAMWKMPWGGQNKYSRGCSSSSIRRERSLLSQQSQASADSARRDILSSALPLTVSSAANRSGQAV